VTAPRLTAARAPDAIARTLLGRLQARARARGEEADVREGSADWLRAHALGVMIAGLEAHAVRAWDQLLADRALGAQLGAQAEVLELVRAESETEDAWRARLIEAWGERLPALSPGDLVALAEEFHTVAEAYAYPRAEPGSTTETLGTTTLVALGPAPGDSTASRVLADPAAVGSFLDGTLDAEGVAATNPNQRPVTCQSGNVSVEAVAEQVVDVTVALVTADTHPWSLSGTTMAIVSSSVNGLNVAGDYTSLAGQDALVNVGTSNYRGGWKRVTLESAALIVGPETQFTFSETQPGAPSGNLRACPASWEDFRGRVLTLFDALGPGSGTFDRWPPESARGRASLYHAALLGAALAADGVLQASVTAPAADPTTPSAKTLLVLGELLATE